MKNLLFFALVLMLYNQALAQQELIGEQWKLHYMIIDGITIDVPQPHPGNFEYSPGIEFYGSSPSDYDVFASIYFNYYFDSEPPTDINANTFTVQAPSVTLGDCEPYCDLEFQYFGQILFGDGPRTFSYEIINESSSDKTMTITTPEGNIAVHGNRILSVNKFDKDLNINVYPNPVKNILNITSKNFSIESFYVYSLLGELIMEQKYNKSHSIDVSSLSEGIYIIEVRSINGINIQKFIKE